MDLQANQQEIVATPPTKALVTCEKGTAPAASLSVGSGSSTFPYNKTSGACCRGAYSQETREIILSLDRATKTAPNGKQILKNVGVGMYLGAKIGFLGQNGSRLLLCCFIRHP